MNDVTRTDTASRVKTIIAEQFGIAPASVADDTTFEALGIDSLDRVELCMFLEEAFEIEIPDEEAEKITTVRQAIDYTIVHAK